MPSWNTQKKDTSPKKIHQQERNEEIYGFKGKSNLLANTDKKFDDFTKSEAF